ncbi:MAG: hypothetical protein M1820_010891 [Bogoriella megaspora]|nr:MAG: hypothetical protein M1820_010891 [Bogoriella megaspora]
MAAQEIREPAKLAPKIDGEVITIDFVPRGKKFYIHRNVLTAPYFQRELKQNQEGDEIYRIFSPSYNPETFHLYVRWLYTGKVWSAPDEDTAENLKHSSEDMMLIKAFCLAGKFEDRAFQDTIIDVLFLKLKLEEETGSRQYHGAEYVNCIWRHTQPGSPLRKLWLDLIVSHGLEAWPWRDYTKDFYLDIIPILLKSRTQCEQSPLKGLLNSCAYHQHTDDRICHKRKRLETGEIEEHSDAGARDTKRAKSSPSRSSHIVLVPGP